MNINKSYPCHSTNYRARRDSIRYIVIHYVGATGSALANVKYYGGTPNISASAHYYVGHASEDGSIYQSVDPKDCAWHCGSTNGKYYSECRNDSSIGIEMCCHKASDGTWYFDDITIEKTIELTKWLMAEYGIDADHVIRHYDVTHKTCPAPFVNDASAWHSFKKDIAREEKHVPKTVYSINDVHVQVIDTYNFKIKEVKQSKKNIKEANYANGGFQCDANSPVGNLVIDGNIIMDAIHHDPKLNLANHELTTLVIHNDNSAEFVKTNDMMKIPAVKYAISGVPIIRNGYKVSMDEIKAEGYYGNELYNTWHGFLGIRHSRLVYVASKLNFELMVYLLEVLGIKDAIKLDGGGSFILHNGNFEIATDENRRINNIITWEG